MLRSAKEMLGYVLEASDGKMGRVKDLLFDDHQWTVRYLVADTGRWLPDRKVLLSPMTLGEPDPPGHGIRVDLTRSQIEAAPSIDSEKPVSRQHEEVLHEHYGIPYYWMGRGLWGLARTPYELRRESELVAEVKPDELEGDPRLRSLDEVMGYDILARDGEIGHVQDFILDGETWALPYMVVDTRDWLPGRSVLLAPRWVHRFDWAGTRAVVELTRDQIRESPEYDPHQPIRPEYREALREHYDSSP
jgi:hypothetical protein